MPASAKRLARKIIPRNSGKSKLFHLWSHLFLKASDHDRWQQEIMAQADYEKLHEDIETFLENGTSDLNKVKLDLSEEQRNLIQNVSYCIYCRMSALKGNIGFSWMTLNEIMKIKPVLKDILVWNAVFPILIQKEYQRETNSEVSLMSNDSGLGGFEAPNEFDNNGNDFQMLPSLPKHNDLTRVSINIEKIGVKDTKLENPFITISVRDSCSVNLTQIQRTAVSSEMQDHHIIFNTRIEIQRYVEKIPKGSNVFFELRHRKNGKYRTKCYALLKKDEIQTTKGFLELYKGAADYHLKNLVRYTNTKPLYLHVDIKLMN